MPAFPIVIPDQRSEAERRSGTQTSARAELAQIPFNKTPAASTTHEAIRT